jgi:drug/metabolite transporter (DMT)-like permease
VTAAAVLLVLLSAALHVAWNLASRRERPTGAFFLVSLAVSALALSPVLLVQRDAVAPVLERVWPFLLVTGVFSTSYNLALAGAYRAADLSLVYPLARSLAPVVVAGVSVALGRGERIGWGCWAGIALIVVGSVLLPVRRFRDLRLDHYLRGGFPLAVIAALSTAGYTLADDGGVRGAGASAGLSPGTAGLVYGALHAWATTAGLTIAVGATARGRAELRAALAPGPARRAAGVGLVSYASYLLVLVAMTLARDVSYVAAFRLLGIPFSVLAAAWVLREPVAPLRWTGAAVVSVGLVGVALR